MRPIALLAALAAAPASAEVRGLQGTVIVDYGLYCAEGGERIDAPETAVGYIVTDAWFEHRAETVRVPARQGIAFGYRYVLPRALTPSMTLSTVHPPFAPGGPPGDVRSPLSTIPAGESIGRLYSFDLSEELAPGEWRLDVLDEAGKALTRARFEVVTDDGTLFPDVTCGAPVVS